MLIIVRKERREKTGILNDRNETAELRDTEKKKQTYGN